jgi:hypothetical protein
MRQPNPNFDVQCLEPRCLLAATPTVKVTHIELQGTMPNVTGVVLTFDHALDPISAQNKASYLLFRRDVEGAGLGGFFGGGSNIIKIIVPFSSAVYDDATHTVTLTPKENFRAEADFRILRIRGRGDDAIRTADGVIIGKDIISKYRPRTARHTRFRDIDGDRVRLDYTGPGALVVLRRNRGSRDPIIYITHGDSTSVFTATLIKSKKGDGVLNVFQFNANGLTNENITNNPAFSIVTINP